MNKIIPFELQNVLTSLIQYILQLKMNKFQDTSFLNHHDIISTVSNRKGHSSTSLHQLYHLRFLLWRHSTTYHRTCSKTQSQKIFRSLYTIHKIFSFDDDRIIL